MSALCALRGGFYRVGGKWARVRLLCGPCAEKRFRWETDFVAEVERFDHTDCADCGRSVL